MASPRSRLRGSLVEREERIQANIALIRDVYLQWAREQGERLGLLMEGYTPFYHSNVHHIGDRTACKELGIRTSSAFRYSFAYSIVTGVDYEELARNPNRFKFYLSTNETAEGRRGIDFIKEILEQAVAQGLSMQLKVESHNYDSCNIYTWHREEMERIIVGVYPGYADIFQNVPRVFQAPIEGIDPEHICWVNEPVSPACKGGKQPGSHSERMGRLGSALEHCGSDISREAYDQACIHASVIPESPHLVRPELLN